MQPLSSFDPFPGILTILAVILLRARAGKPALAAWKLLLAGVTAAYAIPTAFTFLAKLMRATPGLRDLPVIAPEAMYLGAFVALIVLGLGHRPGQPPRVSLWAGLLSGLVAAVLLPPFLNLATGSYQRASLRPDVNHCTQGLLGQAQPAEVVNICDEPITVGLCLPGEVNPAPCAQSYTLEPGETAHLDPKGASLSSLPSNLDGLTVVACPPPSRPSRMGTTIGRGYEGVCIPPP
jgi:hypothetical protein